MQKSFDSHEYRANAANIERKSFNSRENRDFAPKTVLNPRKTRESRENRATATTHRSKNDLKRFIQNHKIYTKSTKIAPKLALTHPHSDPLLSFAVHACFPSLDDAPWFVQRCGPCSAFGPRLVQRVANLLACHAVILQVRF